MRREAIEELELRSGSRKGRVLKAREIFWQLGVEKMGYPGAEVTRYLGVSTSSTNRLAVSEAMPDLKDYLKTF